MVVEKAERAVWEGHRAQEGWAGVQVVGWGVMGLGLQVVEWGVMGLGLQEREEGLYLGLQEKEEKELSLGLGLQDKEEEGKLGLGL